MTNIKDGHYTLGKAYLNNKQYAEAITHFQTVLDFDADFIDAHCGLCDRSLPKTLHTPKTKKL